MALVSVNGISRAEVFFVVCLFFNHLIVVSGGVQQAVYLLRVSALWSRSAAAAAAGAGCGS